MTRILSGLLAFLLVAGAAIAQDTNIVKRSGGGVSLGSGGAAANDKAFVTIGADGDLAAERALTGTANQIVVTDGGANSTVTLSTPQNIHTAATPTFASLTLSGLTANSFLYSGTAGLLTTTAAPTNGQLLIGSTGAAPVRAALTAGTNITVTNAAGAITLAQTQGAVFLGCEGRLTLESGVPVSTTDQTAKTNVFFTPFRGSRCSFHDGTATWSTISFTETTLALGTLTDAKNYDVWCRNNAGTLALDFSAAWTTNTARADALATQDGIRVKSGDTTRRLCGTIRTTSTTTTEDSAAKRFVLNEANQVLRQLLTTPGYNDNNASTTYATASTVMVAANAGTGSKVEYLTDARSSVRVTLNAVLTSDAANAAIVGIGVDSSTVPITRAQVPAAQTTSLSSSWNQPLSNGYHFFDLLIRTGGGTATFFADTGRDGVAAADIRATSLEGGVWQ